LARHRLLAPAILRPCVVVLLLNAIFITKVPFIIFYNRNPSHQQVRGVF